MKKIVYAAALAAALAVPAVMAGPAFASAGPGSNGAAAALTGNGAAAYADPVFGPVQCNETEHPKFDTVECQFTGGQVLTGGQAGTVGWNSDFAGSGHNQGVLTYTVKADGTGYAGKATYPNG